MQSTHGLHAVHQSSSRCLAQPVARLPRVCNPQRLHAAPLHATSTDQMLESTSQQVQELTFTRRSLLGGLAMVASLPASGPANAVQGLTAGRIPGLSTEPDESGFYQYMRPEGKSGGHGVGWSEIPRYAFKVPTGWQEIPVSIADLGGTEIDLRYSSREQGEVAVVVAPILRFADIGFNAKVTIEQLGDPAKIIKGFAPELWGNPIDDEDILESSTVQKAGVTYYEFYVKPYRLVSCTALGNRMFILSATASARQWRKHEDDLRKIKESFYVPDGMLAA